MTSPNSERTSGRWLKIPTPGETVTAFVPDKLPPIPAIDLISIQRLLADANQSLGRLDGVASVLPDTPLFLYMYVRKEALLSSQIEGTQSSLSDLLAHEDSDEPGVPIDDVAEVSNYVNAMEYGLERINNGFPLSVTQTNSRNSWNTDVRWTGFGTPTRRISQFSKLDRRNTPRKRCLCSPSSRRDDGVPAPIRAIHA